MNRWSEEKFVRSGVARAFPATALAASCFLAVLAARMTGASLQAADRNAAATESLMSQPQAEADRKSAGCISCHTQTDEPTMHATGTVRLGCADCHGGNANVR